MNARSSNSDRLSVSRAKGPCLSTVYHTAMEHTAAIAVVTSRRLKRNAAQMMNGRITKVSGNEENFGVPLPKTRNAVSSSDDANPAASHFFAGDQAMS